MSFFCFNGNKNIAFLVAAVVVVAIIAAALFCVVSYLLLCKQTKRILSPVATTTKYGAPARSAEAFFGKREIQWSYVTESSNALFFEMLDERNAVFFVLFATAAEAERKYLLASSFFAASGEKNGLLRYSYYYEDTGDGATTTFYFKTDEFPFAEYLSSSGNDNISMQMVMLYPATTTAATKNIASKIVEVFEKIDHAKDTAATAMSGAFVVSNISNSIDVVPFVPPDFPFPPHHHHTTGAESSSSSVMFIFTSNADAESGDYEPMAIGLNATYEKSMYLISGNYYRITNAYTKIKKLRFWASNLGDGEFLGAFKENASSVTSAAVYVNKEDVGVQCSFVCDGQTPAYAETPDDADYGYLNDGDYLYIALSPKYTPPEGKTVVFYFEIVFAYGDGDGDDN